MTTPENVSDDAARKTARDSAVASNSGLVFPSEDAVHEHYLKWRTTDPFPSIPPALLNSADIVDYVRQTGMIYPFDATKLKPASYEVPLLGPYVYVDEKGVTKRGVLEVGKEIRVAKNSITFLTVEPYFRLPDYIALRHNLKIDHVYKGLLVGTGPLIDPGFVGKISLPLHNLTENDYTFRGGEGVIWVEFTKLSPLPGESGESDLATRDGSYVSFDAAKTRARLVNEYIRSAVHHGEIPASSTAQTARTAAQAKKTADRLKLLFPTFGVVGVVALIIALMNLVVVPRVNDIRDESDRRQDQVNQLQLRLNELEQRLSSPGPSKPPPTQSPSSAGTP
jgi:deoxycytidine triphosphate deaminase